MADQNSFAFSDGGASQAQDNLDRVKKKLNALVETRKKDAADLLAKFQATDIAEQYDRVEQAWADAGIAFAGIMADVHKLLEDAKSTAGSTIKTAGGKIANI